MQGGFALAARPEGPETDYPAEKLYRDALAEYHAGRPAAAEALLRAAIKRNGGHAAAFHQLGLIAQATGRRRLALHLLRRAVELAPRDAIYVFNMGNLLFELERFPDAIAAWHAAAHLKPSFEDAYRNIGLTSMEHGRYSEAERTFRLLTELNGDDADAFLQHGAALRALGKHGAAAAMARGKGLARDATALVRLAARRQSVGRLPHAVALLERAARLAPQDADIRYRLGDVLVDMSRAQDARRAFECALRIDPRHEKAALMLDALDGRTRPTLPPRLVAEEFDRFAPDFDHHLVKCLGYRGPMLVWRAVQRVLRAQGRPADGLAILDIGCGTGLAAPLLAPHAGRLVGVDLSPRMIERARERRLYDRLIVGELTAVMGSLRARFDLVFAADVFIYVGELTQSLQAARRVLKSGGLLGFSIETLTGGGYQLQPTRRYTHSLPYVRRLAARSGFLLRYVGRASLRYERDQPVRANICVLQKERKG